MKKVICLSGISGSGKSTYARNLQLASDESWVIVSADKFFHTEAGYVFDPTKLGEAHARCFYTFIQAMEPGRYDNVVVDNTNTTEAELAPYMLGAVAFGYEPEIVTIRVGTLDQARTCQERNIHGVGSMTLVAQNDRLNNRRLPPWWKQSVVEMGE